MSGVVQLASRLDRAAAGPLKEALLAQPDTDIDLDATEVSHIGALCFQVILSAQQSLQANGHTLRITNATEDTRTGFQLLGLPHDILGDVAI
jgi:chemotaxis protein CheX